MNLNRNSKNLKLFRIGMNYLQGSVVIVTLTLLLFATLPKADVLFLEKSILTSNHTSQPKIPCQRLKIPRSLFRISSRRAMSLLTRGIPIVRIQVHSSQRSLSGTFSGTWSSYSRLTLHGTYLSSRGSMLTTAQSSTFAICRRLNFLSAAVLIRPSVSLIQLARVTTWRIQATSPMPCNDLVITVLFKRSLPRRMSLSKRSRGFTQALIAHATH